MPPDSARPQSRGLFAFASKSDIGLALGLLAAGVCATLAVAIVVGTQAADLRGRVTRSETAMPISMMQREVRGVQLQMTNFTDMIGPLASRDGATLQPLVNAALQGRSWLRTVSYAPVSREAGQTFSATVGVRATRALDNPVTPGRKIVEPSRRGAIERAIVSGDTVATPLVTALADNDNHPVVVLFRALYADGVRPTTVEQRLERVVAVALFVIDVEDMLDAVQSGLPSGDFDYYLYDRPQGEPAKLLAFLSAPTRENNRPLPLESLRAGQHVEEYLRLADRTWTMMLALPGRASSNLWTPGGIVLIGFLFSGIAGGGVVALRGHRRRADRLDEDVTEIRAALACEMAGRHDAQAALDAFAANLPAIVYRRRRDTGGRITFSYFAGRLAQVLGLSPERLREDGSVFAAAVHPDDRERYLDGLHRPAQTGDAVDRHYRLMHGSETIWLHSRATTRILPGGAVEWHGVAIDETESQLARERALYLARHDPETGLLNRGAFIAELGKALNGNAGMGLAMLDVPHLSAVQDAYGIQVIDHVLAAIAERLRGLLPNSDTLSHAGQGQFMAMLPGVNSADDLAAIVRRIEALFADRFSVAGHEFPMQACIGAARYPDDATNGGALLSAAASALSTARRAGRSSYLFDGTKDDRDQRVLLVQEELAGAIERDEFVLYYQPQYAVYGNAMTGMEALVRWQHPKKGLLLPGAFIGAAESSTLIVPLGLQLLRKACAQQRAWLDRGLAIVPVSVNFAAPQLRDPDLVERARAILREFALPPDSIHFEITESMAVHDLDALVGFMRDMRAEGVHFCLDDFGTGYTSLRFLTQLPLDVIKIDRSFVKRLPGHANSRAIIGGIVTMARELNMHVIAEGIETVEQLDALRDLGCDTVQGYLKGRPMPAGEMELRMSMAGDQRSWIQPVGSI